LGAGSLGVVEAVPNCQLSEVPGSAIFARILE
jgi:hypothetical protein